MKKWSLTSIDVARESFWCKYIPKLAMLSPQEQKKKKKERTRRKEKQGLEKKHCHHKLQIPLFLGKNSFTSNIWSCQWTQRLWKHLFGANTVLSIYILIPHPPPYDSLWTCSSFGSTILLFFSSPETHL